MDYTIIVIISKQVSEKFIRRYFNGLNDHKSDDSCPEIVLSDLLTE